MSYIAVYCHIYLNWYASKSFLPDWRFLPEYPTTHVEHSTRLEVSTRLPEYLYPNTYPSNFHQAVTYDYHVMEIMYDHQI